MIGERRVDRSVLSACVLSSRRYLAGLTTQQEWWDFVREESTPALLGDECGDEPLEKLPHRVPARPSVVYKTSGWVNYDDWLGVEMSTDGAAADAGGDGKGEATSD